MLAARVEQRFGKGPKVVITRNMSRGWGAMMPTAAMALSVRKITRHCSERIARRAFELAMTRRKKVTAIRKANSIHMTDGLLLEAVRHVASDFPEVRLDDLLVDASTAHQVREPERFDVLVAANFYGDIISDLASELSGRTPDRTRRCNAQLDALRANFGVCW